jgi:hypothetical protein
MRCVCTYYTKMIIEVIKVIYNSRTGQLNVVLSDGARQILVQGVEDLEQDHLTREFYRLARWSAANSNNL